MTTSCLRYKGGAIAKLGDVVRFVARGMTGWPCKAPVIATGTVVKLGERNVTVETWPNGDFYVGGASFAVRLSVVAHRVSLVRRAEVPAVGE